ncbi:hypothetical protein R3P38DRAFT_2923502 [Favolaschia claudopus]|uniref:Proteophosphoglycan ppg4 n=1 Tax=Favolaschia claudopus TaxID=2862362 RepID=A0AAW0BYN3_9AGAR
MDDPWANAWGEPTAPSSTLPPPRPFPTAQSGNDDEEDITIPTWEPPSWADNNNSNSLWGAARSPVIDKLPSWQSPYDDIPLGKSTTSLPLETETEEAHSDADDDDEPSEEEHVPEPESSPDLEREAPSPESVFDSAPESPIDAPFEIPPVLSPGIPPHSPPGSPDAFGTFETGLDEETTTTEAPWVSSHAAASGVDPADAGWGAAWGSSDDAEDQSDVTSLAAVDEWEAAKQQKALQDKHVPPELLASILLQFTELANDLYPPQSTPNLDPDDYRASRYKGLNGIDSLNPTIARLIPTDLTLPPPLPFQKSLTAKQTTEALRLSRSASFVRFSPLSHYSATKGSTAWEASLKSRPEKVGEPDLLPPGWRIVETNKEDGPVADKKKSGHGGLLSFFGRRTAAPPAVSGPETPRSASPASVASPRASLDSSIKSPTSSITTKSPTTTTSSATSAAPSMAASPTVSSSSGSGSAPPPPPAPPIMSPTTSVHVAEADPVTPVSAPSAVSRFLGRFGRKAPAAGGRQSLALSDGDFEFLSDIDSLAADGPSSGHPASTSDFSMSGALLDDPVPLPAKLAPPPQAQAPRGPVIPAAGSLPMPMQNNNGQDARRPSVDSDELAFFGNFTPPPTTSKLFSPAPLGKPFSPQIVHTSSAPAPAAPPPSMPAVDSDVDFSAWGFDDEEKGGGGGVARSDSEPVHGTTRPPARQVLNTRAATTSRGTLPPPRRVTAIMSSGPTKPPSVIPKLDASFTFAPPPTQSPSVTPTLAPPPGSRPPAKKANLFDDDDDDFSDFHAHVPSRVTPATSSNSLYAPSFSSSTSSDRGLFSSTSSSSVPANLFDDFDDFMQAAPQDATMLRTPSPPRPIAKSPRMQPPAPLSFGSGSDANQDGDDTPLAVTRSSLQQKQRAANHQRATSLVENAAASSGVRWPAPESPLPEAIAPPPDASDPFGFNAGSSSRMQSQQASFMQNAQPLKASFSLPPSSTPSLRSLSPPVLPPPPQTSAPKLAPPPGSGLRAFTPPVPSPPPTKMAASSTPLARFPPPPGGTPMRTFSTPLQTPVMPLPSPQNGMPPPMLTAKRPGPVPLPPSMTTTASGKSSGGLSAQDLSFFEGL